MLAPPDPDEVHRLVAECYERQLPASGKPRVDAGEGTVVAAILLQVPLTPLSPASTSSSSTSSALPAPGLAASLHLVALGTGTRSVGGSGVCGVDPRFSLGDCHAEVLCRRAFCAFVLEEAARAAKGDGGGDANLLVRLQRRCEHCGSCGSACELRRDVAVVMYLSQSPCGAASLHEGGGVTGAHKLLRPGVAGEAGGCGVLDHAADLRERDATAVRVKPGKGAPSPHMSCSDKLSRWAALGLLGAAAERVLQCVRCGRWPSGGVPLRVAHFVLASSAADAALERAALERCLKRGFASAGVAVSVLLCSATAAMPWLPRPLSPAAAASDGPVPGQQLHAHRRTARVQQPCGASIAAIFTGIGAASPSPSPVVVPPLLLLLDARPGEKRNRDGRCVPLCAPTVVVLNSKLGVPLGVTVAALAAATKPSASASSPAELLESRAFRRLLTPISRLALGRQVAATVALLGSQCTPPPEPAEAAPPPADTWLSLKRGNAPYAARRTAFLDPGGPFALWVRKPLRDFSLNPSPPSC